jgi:hypothetical protein
MNQYKDLLLPLLRNNLIQALEDLANAENQLLTLLNDNYIHTLWDSILRTINVFDELDMHDSPPKKHIGYTLYNSTEAQAISTVITAITSICDKIGINKSDSAYINSSLWEKVICTAKRAHIILLANEESNLFDIKYEAQGDETADFDLKENNTANLWVWVDRCHLSKQTQTSVAHGRDHHDLHKRTEV